MKIKFLSLDTTSSLSLDVSQRLIFDSIAKYFDEADPFKRSNEPGTFLKDLSASFSGTDVVLVGAETSVYLATKKLLAKALSLPTAVNKNIRDLISFASSRTSEEESDEHSTIPIGAVEFPSDNGLFSGYAFKAGNQWLILVPMGTRKLEYIVDSHLVPFITGTLGLTYEEPVVTEKQEEQGSELYEAVTKGVFALRQAEASCVFAATKTASYVKEACAKIDNSDTVVFFSDFYKDRTDSDVKQYVIDLAVGARESRENAHYGVAISNVLKTDASADSSYFMYVAIADDESAKIATVHGEKDEPAESLVQSCISTAFSLLYEKSVERYETKKGGADYSKKGAEELSTERERNIRKRKIGTTIRVFLALIGIGILAALYLWLFSGCTANAGHTALDSSSVISEVETVIDASKTEEAVDSFNF